MERLTERFDNGQAAVMGCGENCKYDYKYCRNHYEDCPEINKIYERLAEYEDTGLTPEQIQELEVRNTAKAAIITGHNRAIGCKVGECPTCGAMTRDYLEFCSECGQRIKWED